MRVVVQRVTEGSVSIVEPPYKREIGKGYVILLGIRQGDTVAEVQFLADKCSNLRVFEDENGKMNNSIIDTGGEVLLISQFTLYGDASKGRRPDFTAAANPPEANRLYEHFVKALRARGLAVKTGVFAADMEVEIINDGPVTIWLDSKK